MAISTVDKAFILQVYKKYQSEYDLHLPKINDIKEIHTDEFWGRFNSDDLYNGKYILFICDDLLSKNKQFISQILYHEFTHLSDSIIFRNESNEKYKSIMVSYSEFHASQVEMEKLIKTSSDIPVTLDSTVKHAGYITIKKYMDESFEFVKSDLEKMSKNTSTDNFYYNTNHIYYFFGYVSALKICDLSYTYNIYSLSIGFIMEIENIENTLLSPNIGIDIVYKDYTKLENAIKEKCILNGLLSANNIK